MRRDRAPPSWPPTATRRPPWARRSAAARTGDRVLVRYLPEAPERAVTADAASGGSSALMLLPLAFLGVFVIIGCSSRRRASAWPTSGSPAPRPLPRERCSRGGGCLGSDRRWVSDAFVVRSL
ncbi:DUF3592 domain-containing protein [Streptomyces sp. NPDC006739]|uniref:DUF3592 domain-containing protein n=1 Tax=Streptomyces sp. NPDC006739 TaxID=3364763 RepID=UPI003679E5F9